MSGVDFQKIRYFVPVENHRAYGYYLVEAVEATDMSEMLEKEQETIAKSGKKSQYKGFDKPIRISMKLGKYEKLLQPFSFGIDSQLAVGIAMTRKEFKEYGCI